MALRRDLTYPLRYDAATPNQPQGAFKNRTAPEVLDGSYLEEGWLNDWSGFMSRLLVKAGITPNNVVDDALSSQYMDAADIAFYKRIGRNQYINGNFSVWQRGFNIVGIPSGGQVTADQWKLTSAGGVLNGATAQSVSFDEGQTEVKGNPLNYMRWTGNIGTNAAQEFVMMGNPVEDVRRLGGKMCTVRFNIKGSINGTVGFYLSQFFGPLGSPPTNPIVESFNITTDWEEKTFTFLMPDLDLVTIDPAGSFLYSRVVKQVGTVLAGQIGFPAAINYVGSIDMAQFQLEEGIVATQYEDINFEQQLMNCYRYFQRHNLSLFRPYIGRGQASNRVYSGARNFYTTMRTSPVSTSNNVADWGGVNINNTHGPGEATPVLFTSQLYPPLSRNSWYISLAPANNGTHYSMFASADTVVSFSAELT